MKKIINGSLLLATIIIGFNACNSNQIDKESQKIKNKKERELGEKLFFDTLLSKNGTQSCSTCHNPENGFVDNRVHQRYHNCLLTENLLVIVMLLLHTQLQMLND